MAIGRRNFLTGAGLLLAGGVRPAPAQSAWPTRPVRFIVPLAAGGAMDFAARQCGVVLSRNIGQQVFVENRTGAGGTIGMDAAMKSPPDGYTFLVTNDNAAIAPHILNLAYDYTKELLPVITITRQPVAFAVHPSLGVKSIAELVSHAKRNPGLGFASSGVGSNQHVVGTWFAKEAGIRLEHVPYRRAGTITIIAQTSPRRSIALPDVPTLEEAGFKGMTLESWFGLFAPPGTPRETIMALNAATETALGDPALQSNFTKASLEAVGGTPEALGLLARADSEKYQRLVKELNISG